MTTNVVNLLILVGAVHGLVLSLLLVTSRRGSRSSNCLLAAMLVCFTLPILKIVLRDVGFFEAYRITPWTLELLYGLGPSLYLYVKQQTRPRRDPLTLREWLHFLPVAFEILYYLSPAYGRHATQLFWPAHSRLHLLWMAQQALGVVLLLIYIYLANRRLRVYAVWVGDNFSSVTRRNLRWLSLPVGLYTVFFCLWFGVRMVDVVGFGDALTSTAYYPLLVFLAGSTYWIGTTGYLHRSEPVVDPLPRSFDESPRGAGAGSASGAALASGEGSASEADRASAADWTSEGSRAPHAAEASQAGPGADRSDADEASEVALFAALEAVMLRDRPYLSSDLSLAQLARTMDVNQRLLSRTINAQAKVNFYDYVNGYRISEVQRLLGEPDQSRSLLDLAFEAGFGSKATFNAAFKKRTGKTPSQYRRDVRPAGGS